MDRTIEELTGKVDALSEQIAFLTEEAQIQRQRRQEWDELKSDMTPVVSEVYNRYFWKLVLFIGVNGRMPNPIPS